MNFKERRAHRQKVKARAVALRGMRGYAKIMNDEKETPAMRAAARKLFFRSSKDFDELK